MLIFGSSYLISSPFRAAIHRHPLWKFCTCVSFLHRFPVFLHPAKTLYFFNLTSSLLRVTPPGPPCLAPTQWWVTVFVATEAHFPSFPVWELSVNVAQSESQDHFQVRHILLHILIWKGCSFTVFGISRNLNVFTPTVDRTLVLRTHVNKTELA